MTTVAIICIAANFQTGQANSNKDQASGELFQLKARFTAISWCNRMTTVLKAAKKKFSLHPDSN